MAIRKPVRRMPSLDTENAPATLMGNQDTVNKGDSLSGGRRPRRRVDLLIPERRYERMRLAADELDVTITRVINDGIDLWLDAHKGA